MISKSPYMERLFSRGLDLVQRECGVALGLNCLGHEHRALAVERLVAALRGVARSLERVPKQRRELIRNCVGHVAVRPGSGHLSGWDDVCVCLVWGWGFWPCRQSREVRPGETAGGNLPSKSATVQQQLRRPHLTFMASMKATF